MHLKEVLAYSGLSPPTSGNSIAAEKQYYSSLIEEHNWTYNAALHEMSQMLPSGRAIVVYELLVMENLEGNTWLMALDLSRQLQAHVDESVLRAWGTIIQTNEASPSNSYSDGLITLARIHVGNSAQFNGWFEAVTGLPYSTYVLEKRQMESLLSRE